MKNIILGIVLILAALWGAAWLLHELGVGHWALFPVLATSILIFAAGWLLLGLGILGHETDA